MKNIYLALLLILPLTAFSQQSVPQIVSNDTITAERTQAKEVGRILTFEDPKIAVLKIFIEDNGDRKYSSLDGVQVFVTDKTFTRIFTGKKKIEEKRRLQKLPASEVVVGKEWDVPWIRTTSDCGLVEVNYHAVAKAGPDFSLTIDGIDTTVKTILIDYQVPLSSAPCLVGKELKRQILYSVDLNELVSEVYTDKYLGFLETGYMIVVKSIQTSKGTISK